MPTVDVIDLNNQKVGELELADEVFGAEVNESLLYEAVRQYRANQRAGTHKTKVRSEVAGSGKKLWKQKGTGRARMGSIRSPLWRHGGTVHGPVPRDYSYKLPRKMVLGALRSALSAKVRDGELKVVQAFTLPDHKTRNAMNALANVASGRTVLLVDDDARNIFALSSVLERRGMRVLAATTGREAIGRVESTPDLAIVLMDIMMPEMDGYQTIGVIRENPAFRRLPIIALTAKAMKGDREKCLEAGASDYLAKPVNTEQLLSALRMWLHR